LAYLVQIILLDKTHSVVENSGGVEARNSLEQLAEAFANSWQNYMPEITCVPWSSDAALPVDKQYVFAIHPHGIHCLGLAAFQTRGSTFHQRFPGLHGPKLCGLAATVIFKIPVVRELFLFWGYIDASRTVASQALGKGQSLYVVVGGEEESMMTTWGKDIVVLKKRKGFVRLALSHGVTLVPIFAAGTTDCYRTYSFLAGSRRWLQKSFGIALPIFHGRWMTTLPYKVQVKILVGEPIPTPMLIVEGARPNEELVDEYHQKYMDALVELHAKYAPDRELVIC
jgi:1-acyl-sn-glycerol-3-phosphate acyltransferase